MNRQVKQEIEKVSKAELIPTPANNQAYIDSMAQKVLSGELTYYDIGRELQLTVNQIKYCEEFALGEKMGNGTEAALRAYGFNPADRAQRQSAANYACQFNKPSHPCHKLIQIMINGAGLNANNLDQNLLFVCQQNEDLKAKTLAIREANTILGRNNTKKIEVTINIRPDFSGMTNKEMEKFIELGRKVKLNGPEQE